MNASQYDYLKSKFNCTMHRKCHRNQNLTKDFWDKLVQMHENRPYHNLLLSKEDLDSVDNMHVSDELMMALFTRYTKFNVHYKNTLKESADYIGFVLMQNYGWYENDVQKVYDLIISQDSLNMPKVSDDYQFKLIYDMKMARLAKKWEAFRIDRDFLMVECTKLDNKKFWEIEQKLFQNLLSRTDLFCLNSYRERFDSELRKNLQTRLEQVSIKLSNCSKNGAELEKVSEK